MYVVYICNIYRLGFAMKQQGNQRKTWCDVFWHLWSEPHHHPGDFGFFLQLQGSKGLNLRLLVLQCMKVKIGLPKKCCNSRRTIDCKHLDGAASKYEAAAEVPDADFLHCKTVAHPCKLCVMSDCFASHHRLFCRNKICTIQQVGYVCTNAEGKWMWANQKDGSISWLRGTASRRSVFRFLWGKCMGSRKMR